MIGPPSRTRPWWWWLNPWLYIARRDRAYNDALVIIREDGAEIASLKRGLP